MSKRRNTDGIWLFRVERHGGRRQGHFEAEIEMDDELKMKTHCFDQ